MGSYLLQLLKLRSFWKLNFGFGDSEAKKLIIKLLTIFFFLLLYIHFSTCIIFEIAKQDKKWIPPVVDSRNFYQLSSAT